MPRYFFHVRNGLGFVADDEGRELDGDDAARAVAIDGVRSLLSDEVRSGRLDLRGRLEVADGDGRTVLIVPFGETVEIRIGGVPSGDDPSRGPRPEPETAARQPME